MTDTNMNQVKVKIVTMANGRKRAAYCSMLADGQWDRAWFSMTVADARKALAMGWAHIGIHEHCRVELG